MSLLSNKYRPIQILPVALANQIAAGEVIERPASCIKELLENSLDAGATEIHIDIDAGGMRQIIITDNGRGITKEDLPLTIAAHATSKIQVQQDLFHLTTLGFRGEALASIQAVSKVEIISKRPKPETKAYKLIAYKDTPISEAHFAGDHGTTVVIKDLFYNVPARKKFLKSAKTEYLHIESLVTALALSHPEVAICFNHNEKQVYYLPKALTAAQLQSRVTKLLGKSFTEHAIEINIERVGLSLTGFLGLPETFARTNHQQYFYINGRLIKDKLITHAIKSFFQEKQLLGQGMYPAYVLYFTINPEDVDVNVHPTKHEVRFHEPRLIHDFITSSLASVVTQTGLISDPEVYTEIQHAAPILKFNDTASPALLKQPTEPSFNQFRQELPISRSPIIKIGKYLLLGESIEQPGQGKIIDIILGQEALITDILESDQNIWFESHPLLVPLTIATPHTEQWVWPDRMSYFASHFGLIYQFKQKKEMLVTHLPQIFKHLTHQERIEGLSRLFQQALHNGQAEYHNAFIHVLPKGFLCRLPLEAWGAVFPILDELNENGFIRPIDLKVISNLFMIPHVSA
jgi:DNA mismatch repair protein MutL